MREDTHVTSGGCACEYHVKSEDHYMEDAVNVTSSGHVTHVDGLPSHEVRCHLSNKKWTSISCIWMACQVRRLSHGDVPCVTSSRCVCDVHVDVMPNQKINTLERYPGHVKGKGSLCWHCRAGDFDVGGHAYCICVSLHVPAPLCRLGACASLYRSLSAYAFQC